MAKDAEAHASEDRDKREEIEARNSLDSLVYSIEKMLKDNGDKIQGPERTEAKGTIGGTPSVGDLKAAHEKLTQASHKLAEVLYKANAAQAAAQAPPSGDGTQTGPAEPGEQKKDEGVIDAEYVDVDDKK
jgi:molecular chaperone DnaK